MLTAHKKSSGVLTGVQAGLTLIELMVVVSVLGILTALAMPNYRIWIENTRIRNAAESIQTGLQKARLEAIKHNAPVRFVLGANSAWTVGCVTPVLDINNDGVDDCPATIESRAASEGSSANISVTVTPNGATTSIFNNLGTVATPVRFDVDSATLTAAASRDLRINIGVGGISRMCDPYSGLAAADPRRC